MMQLDMLVILVDVYWLCDCGFRYERERVLRCMCGGSNRSWAIINKG